MSGGDFGELPDIRCGKEQFLGGLRVENAEQTWELQADSAASGEMRGEERWVRGTLTEVAVAESSKGLGNRWPDSRRTPSPFQST